MDLTNLKYKKVNIKIEEGINLLTATGRVMQVINEGRISGDETKFCAITTWGDGIVCVADQTKTGTDTFTIARKK